MIRKPGIDGRDLAVGQERHDPSPLQITDDRAVVVIAPEGPIIDANNAQPICVRASPAPYDPQQCVVAGRHHQPLGGSGGWPSAERQPKMMDDAVQPRGPARAISNNVITEALGEDSASTGRSGAGKTAGEEPKLYLLAGTGQIGNRSNISTVHSRGRPST